MDIEIKDRVAVGDNKYTMRTLSDGRVELTPSPDSVQEPGTPLNKALLQPIVDSAYDVIYSLDWYPDRNNALEFNDGQTFEGLVEDLTAEKAVKIKVKKSGEPYYYEAEVETPEAALYVHVTEVTYSPTGSVRIIVHCWRWLEAEDYTIRYASYEVSKLIEQLKGKVLEHADSINNIVQIVQMLNDRITALESKIS